ncbi:hypothetical protein Tco_1057031 [Tanacetum coccineum]|uniref:Uncharacterized protein n=1 Tax=Tanacetum coccineum TaxID=301880 RepID=A0ABQ5H4F7_9ASTR
MENNNNKNRYLLLRSILEKDKLIGPKLLIRRGIFILFFDINESATMSLEFQVNYMDVGAFDLINQLMLTFQTQARTERFDALANLSNCKMAEGSLVSAHVIIMIGHISRLERLGRAIAPELVIYFILNSLSKEYKQFILNYNMNNFEGGTIAELHNMLKTTERGMKHNSKDALLVASENNNKNGDKRWTEAAATADEECWGSLQ